MNPENLEKMGIKEEEWNNTPHEVQGKLNDFFSQQALIISKLCDETKDLSETIDKLKQNNDNSSNTSDVLIDRNEPFNNKLESILKDKPSLEHLKEKNKYLENRLKFNQLKEAILLFDPNRNRIVSSNKIITYIIGLTIFVLITGFLLSKATKDNIEVSINYDIGVIMGGVLTGTAALIAATSYAKRNERLTESGYRHNNESTNN